MSLEAVEVEVEVGGPLEAVEVEVEVGGPLEAAEWLAEGEGRPEEWAAEGCREGPVEVAGLDQTVVAGQGHRQEEEAAAGVNTRRKSRCMIEDSRRNRRVHPHLGDSTSRHTREDHT